MWTTPKASCFVESFIDGITERGLYEISIRYRKPSIALVVGSGTYLIGFEKEKQNDEQLSMQTELEQR